MIQLSENRRLTAYFLGVVAVLVWSVVLILSRLLNVSDLPTALKHLGIASIVAYLASLLLYSYLWHRRPFRSLLGIPDFSGRWEGWYWNTLGRKWLPTAHEIRQRSLDLSAHAWGQDNWSHSTCVSIVTDREGGTPHLICTYKTENTRESRAGTDHSGTHLLNLVFRDEKKHLEGKYFTNRVRREDKTIGMGGFIRLVWVGKDLRNTLDYAEDNWGMPKPDDSDPPA